MRHNPNLNSQFEVRNQRLRIRKLCVQHKSSTKEELQSNPNNPGLRREKEIKTTTMLIHSEKKPSQTSDQRLNQKDDFNQAKSRTKPS